MILLPCTNLRIRVLHAYQSLQFSFKDFVVKTLIVYTLRNFIVIQFPTKHVQNCVKHNATSVLQSFSHLWQRICFINVKRTFIILFCIAKSLVNEIKIRVRVIPLRFFRWLKPTEAEVMCF